MNTEEAVEHVRRVFAQELAQLQDRMLGEKVVRTWAQAMLISGSTDLSSDLRMNPELSGIGLEHVRAVVKLSTAMADALTSGHQTTLDRDVVVAGALLHDVGKLPEYSSVGGHVLASTLVRHAFSGVAIAAAQGVPTPVLHIIAYHSIEGQRVRRTAECEVVFRADEISADALYRRELGVSRAERMPSVYLPPVLA